MISQIAPFEMYNPQSSFIKQTMIERCLSERKAKGLATQWNVQKYLDVLQSGLLEDHWNPSCEFYWKIVVTALPFMIENNMRKQFGTQYTTNDLLYSFLGLSIEQVAKPTGEGPYDSLERLAIFALLLELGRQRQRVRLPLEELLRALTLPLEGSWIPLTCTCRHLQKALDTGLFKMGQVGETLEWEDPIIFAYLQTLLANVDIVRSLKNDLMNGIFPISAARGS
jgi:hypothetical protein